ncbi:lipoprotein-releasing ABC transporter permease subunit [Komagataeibacter intermedius]|uniref:Lipoprotein releasing system transmembrane protein LolC/E n=2 Tax=Komagataeibacter intermedius TaxID=66229 RepID=A0A0N1FDS2_9PROT|nr:lipoprotein-releasing ABC transporter permease subunit [Komagataeibacter intermedius]KPH88895.1 lipoprotein releasing system transmembrane protein LolC/E [Komagataeibacter intermedius AF2]MCF3634962.1 lipoprotein-releasing ABC transporter permease subunit [Komagataeibacter intermedius]GAN86304.1 lipoprotein releasing system transmembrane protein LolC/E [Komagataeibacter intermedius TF2]GBQ66486.1 lipoprotein releasing system transmembrane protein LolC/E [Komagataeibacter intermedius NRIC 052
MFGPFERMVAGRYLHARRGERFVSVIAIFSLVGIALGVATLIIVMSVMNGFKADLLGRILGLNGDLSVFGVTRTISDYDDVAARVRRVPGVVSAAPLVESQVLLNSGSYNAGGLVRGMTQADLLGLHEISDNLVAGSLDDFGGDDTIIVGTTLAERAGLTVGGRLTLVSPQGAATAFGTMPRVRAYRVVAIFDAGVNDYNASYVFLPLHAAQVYFQMPGQVTQVQVMTRDAENVIPVRQAIEKAMDGNVRVMDWTQTNNAFFGAVQVEQNVMFLILTLIILVAAFNVISSLIMMVKDKSADIAVLRTLGATRGAIMRIFLMCGASVGVTGTFAGTGLGIVFCMNIEHIRQLLQRITGTNLFNPEVYYLEHLPSRLIWSQVIEVIAMALVLSLLATLYPSWRAAKTDPVEALRHE